VLLVEDDPSVRRLAARSLIQLGYEVIDAASAREAVEAAARCDGRIACAIVDLVLPDAAGREAVASLRAAGAEAPVLYVSGWGDDASSGEAFLGKPYAPIDLARRVRVLLDAAAGGARRRPQPDARASGRTQTAETLGTVYQG
jgi:DNA-binding response OmpR family regulator